MKNMFSIILFTGILSFFSICHAASGGCATFLSDFKQMTIAQDSIQQSLISNHDMMADSLDTYADGLKESSGKAYKKIVENMYKAGESVRKRKTKAQDISKEFALKANELLKTAEKCVKK
jgi:hypothetical protein